MIIKQVEAKNVYSFDEIKVSFTEFPITQVIGDNRDEARKVNTEEDGITYSNVNGVGKTNLYNLIIQAMYSRDIYKTKKNFLKNMFTKGSFYIKLEIELENNEYLIHYSSDDTILYKNGEKYLSGRKAVTDFFEALIPFELFLHLTYISSSIFFPFFTATPKEQKEFLMLIFSDLVKFRESIPLLKEEATNCKQELVKVKTQIEVYSKIPEVTEKIQQVPEILDLQDFITEINELKTLIQEQKSEKKLINECNKILEKELVEVKDSTEDLEKYKVRKIKGELLISTTRKDIDKIQKVKDYSICPLCSSKIEFDKEGLDEKLEYLKKLQETLKEVSTIIRDQEQKKSDFTNYIREKEKREQVQEIKDKNKYVEGELARLTAKGQELNKLEVAQVAKAKEIQEMREQVISNNAKIEAMKAQATEVKTELEKLSTQQQELEGTESQIKLLSKICEDVIISKQIPKRLEILETFINLELANFTSQFKITLEMQKDKILRNIIKEDKIYPIENLSTGEKARVNLSLIFAIRSILNKLHKKIYNINILFVDELLGVLDFSGKHLLLETLKTYNLNQFIVSHDYLFEEVETLTLIRENNKTRLQT